MPTPTGDGSRTKFDGPEIVAVFPVLTMSILFRNVETPDTFNVPLTSRFDVGLKVDIPTLLLNIEMPDTFTVPLTSRFADGLKVDIPRSPETIVSPRTSNDTLGSKIVVPIPTRPTTSNTFSSSVLLSIPIFCCCYLRLR